MSFHFKESPVDRAVGTTGYNRRKVYMVGHFCIHGHNNFVFSLNITITTTLLVVYIISRERLKVMNEHLTNQTKRKGKRKRHLKSYGMKEIDLILDRTDLKADHSKDPVGD